MRRAERRGCSCLHFKQLPLISSARLCSVQSKQRPQSSGKGGKKSNNFGLLCCSLLIATEEAAAPRKIQIKNHAKWTSSWQLSFKCTLLIRRAGPRPAQHKCGQFSSLSLSISLDSRFYSTRAATCRNQKEETKKNANLIVSGKFLLKSWPTTFRSLFMRRYSLSLKS